MSGSSRNGSPNYPAVTATVNQQTVTFAPRTAEQYNAATAFVQASTQNPQFLAGIDAGQPTLVGLGSMPREVAVFGAASHVVVGAALANTTADPVNVLLDGQGSAYVTGFVGGTGTADSVVTAYDNTGSAVVNLTANSNLIAFTGAGANALGGFAGNNDFTTGAGGQDVVYLDGTTNRLSSGGADAVLVGGASTITAAPGGSDSVLLTGPATLLFENRSSLASTITGATGASVFLNLSAGGAPSAGSTSVTAASGENFTIDSSAGNTTLTGSSGGGDNFVIDNPVYGQAGHTARVTISNYVAGDTLTFADFGGNVGTGTSLPYTESFDPVRGGFGTGGTTTFNLYDGSTVVVTGAPVGNLKLT